MTESPESAARDVVRLHREGRTSAALTLAREAALAFSSSPLTHANLGFMLLTSGEYAEARRAYERALFLQPQHQEARRGLAVARRFLGEDAAGDSLSIVPFTGSGRAIDVLVPLTLGGGNLVIDELFDSTIARVTKLAVELHEHAELPPHDVIFNAVGDPDASPQALEKLQWLIASSTRPVLNPPELVLHTGRVEQSARLGEIDGVRTPRIRRVSSSERDTVAVPVLLRAPGFHAGAHFERVEREEDREAALRLPTGDLFAIEFVDTRDSDGLFAKYRVVAIDGTIYPVHLAISRQWKVHYFSAEMAECVEHRERERLFLENPRAAVGARAWNALERIIALCGLHYGGVDFALRDDGDIVVFECNATMAVRYPPEGPVWSYRRPAVDAIRDAMRAMLARYSSA